MLHEVTMKTTFHIGTYRLYINIGKCHYINLSDKKGTRKRRMPFGLVRVEDLGHVFWMFRFFWLSIGMWKFKDRDIKVYVDDIRTAPEGWTTFRTAEEAWPFLQENWAYISDISLDHDLGEGETGYDLLCKIEKLAIADCPDCIHPQIHIHTANTGARAKMELAADKLNNLLEDKLNVLRS